MKRMWFLPKVTLNTKNVPKMTNKSFVVGPVIMIIVITSKEPFGIQFQHRLVFSQIWAPPHMQMALVNPNIIAAKQLWHTSKQTKVLFHFAPGVLQAK